MKQASQSVPFLAAGSAILALLGSACSSGLGHAKTPLKGSPNPNVSTGLFLMPQGKVLPSPVTEHDAAGALIPTAWPASPREVVFYAFASDTNSHALDDGFVDGNGAGDVFLVAVDRSGIDTDAFSYSLAGKFRHPRCVACHMMDADLTWAFRNAAGSYGGHITNLIPGGTFTDNSRCGLLINGNEITGCHNTILDAYNDLLDDPDRELWFAPPSPALDFRYDDIERLAERTQESTIEHFRFNARIIWPIEGGDLPVGGPNTGFADNNFDGRDTPEDSDLFPRVVPGGLEPFMDQVGRFVHLDAPVDTRAAIADVALVSRARMNPGNSGNGASREPSVSYVPNEDYDGASSSTQTAGVLTVAFTSDATDLLAAGLNSNGVSDVYVARFEVRVSGGHGNGQGPIELEYLDTRLVSNQSGSAFFGGDAASGAPDVSGDGRWVAFESDADDLAGAESFNDRNGTEMDVFLWSRASETSLLVSVADGLTADDGADGDSRRPAVDEDGATVAFDSEATDLVAGDTNGHRDVFYARLLAGSVDTIGRASVHNGGGEASDGDGDAVSQNADVLAEGGDLFVCFESTIDDLDDIVGATDNTYAYGPNTGNEVQSEVYLHRVSDQTTILVSRSVDAVFDRVLSNHDSRNPRFGAGADRILFETEANDLDRQYVVLSGAPFFNTDENYFPDVIVADASQALAGTGEVRGRGVSVSVDGAFGNGESTLPACGPLRGPKGVKPGFSKEGFVCFLTRSWDLGGADMEFVEIDVPAGQPIPDPPLRYAVPTPIVVFQAPLGKLPQ